MGGNALIYQILVVLVFLGFCVLTYFFTKTWRALHVIAVFLTFVMAMVMASLIALNLKTQKEWRALHKDLVKRLADEELIGEKLAHGDPNQVEQTATSVRSEAARYGRVLYDRGRIWRGTQPVDISGGAAIVRALPAGAPADAKHNIATNSIVYVFKDIPYGGRMVPGVYLGEFRVTQAADGDPNITISPTIGLDSSQAQHANLRDANTTWTIYEMMPQDDHRVFSTSNTVYEKWDDRVEQPVFGEMDEARLRDLLGTAIALRNNPNITTKAELDAKMAELQDEVNETVERYRRDGSRADTTIDDPENIWIKLQFLQQFGPITVDSDVAEVALRYFDASGRAVSPRLQRGTYNPDDDKVTYQPDNIGVFPQEYAEDTLITPGVAREITPIYVRHLNGYRHDFHAVFDRMKQVEEDSRRAQKGIDHLTAAIEDCQKQIRYRTAERDSLNADLVGFKAEQKSMTDLVADLQNQKSELTANLSRLYQTNLILEQEISAAHAKLTEQINARTEAAGESDSADDTGAGDSDTAAGAATGDTAP